MFWLYASRFENGYNFFVAPGVADLATAGNWAEQYLAAEARSKASAGMTGGGSNWAAEFLEGRTGVPHQPGPVLHPHHPTNQWARDYLAQNEHKVW